MSPPPPLHWRPSTARRVLQDTTVVWAARRRLVRSRIAARPPVAALVRLIRAARWRLVRSRVAARPPVAALVCVVRVAQRRLVRSRVSFDCTSWPAPLPPHLLFASSGRRKGDSFDRASRRAPPRAFERLLGEGTQGERGGIVRIGGRGMGRRGRDGNGFFIVIFFMRNWCFCEFSIYFRE